MSSSLTREADTALRHVPPVRVSELDLRSTVHDVVEGVQKDDVMGLASELAFHLSLTVFPFLLLISSLPSVAGALFSVPDPGDRFAEELTTLVSKDSADVAKNLIHEMTRTAGWTAFFLGLGGAL